MRTTRGAAERRLAILGARAATAASTGDWRIWLFLGGRGAGKTRAGAEWIADGVRAGPHAPGRADRRHLARCARRDGGRRIRLARRGAGSWNSSAPTNLLRWPGGATAMLLSAEEPDALRGHQFDGIWGDEFAKWRDPQAALDMALMTHAAGRGPAHAADHDAAQHPGAEGAAGRAAMWW